MTTNVPVTPKAEDTREGALLSEILAEGTSSSNGKQKGKDVESALALAYLYLADSVEVQHQTAMTGAKILNSQGNEEIALNKEMGELDWISIPKFRHWKTTVYTETKYGVTHANTVTKSNRDQIDKAQLANQQQDDLRQSLQGELQTSFQVVETGETKWSDQMQSTMTTISESTSLLRLLKRLTAKIMYVNG